MINQTLNEADSKMGKAVEVTREDFAAIRTGRANPSMFHKLTADYYGAPTPLQQLASFTVPEARVIIISPYDAGAMTAIEKAIRDSDLGVNPTDDGKTIRVDAARADRGAPQGLHQDGQGQGRGRQDLRPQHPPHAKQSLDKLEKDGEVGKDDVTGAEKRLDGDHQEAHRRHRRAAQAQGSRAARGLRTSPTP